MSQTGLLKASHSSYRNSSLENRDYCHNARQLHVSVTQAYTIKTQHAIQAMAQAAATVTQGICNHIQVF